MRNEKIILAELDIETKGAFDALEQTKKKSEELKNQLDKLTESGQKNSEHYKKIEAEIRQLNIESKSLTSIIDAQLKKNADLIKLQ